MGEEVAIDADAYMAELREEVETLRTELDRVEGSEEATQSACWPTCEPAGAADGALTSEITDDVLDGMKKLSIPL